MPSTNEPPSPAPLSPRGRGEDRWDDARIVGLRPAKSPVDPSRPYAFLVEPERTATGAVEDTAVLFLTNRECPFRCLMCDLWKNTTDHRVPDGAIACQIEYALPRLPSAQHIKLYNAGNFFDAQAVPAADWPRIAELLDPFQTVIVESHPRLVGPRCLALRDMLRPALQVAMGLETVHPEVLPRLNKRMTLADFEAAARFLCANSIAARAFILLRPPFLNEEEGVHWAKESIRFAFDVGVECCVVIPTRGGNGAMEELERQGHFAPPRMESLEEVLDHGVSLQRGRVFADLWDAERFSSCRHCGPARMRRLNTTNLTQQPMSPVVCSCRGTR
jgi:archaeosine synthase beta-subunit